VIKTLATTAAASGIWDDRPERVELHARLQKVIQGIGVPTRPLIEGIKAKDKLLEPEALLKAMRSADPLQRNRAIRFATLARVRNPFRPGAMTREEFLRRMTAEYLARFEVFSVESHLLLLTQLRSSPGLARVFAEVAAEPAHSARVAALREFLASSPAQSLRGLPKLIDSMCAPEAPLRKAG
ncbi:MAG: hypothetical protein NDJ90_11600, partial [Oligoflexia bacterium]|nr:hypothetical protein [Oligoflexia bacterium]